MYCCPECPPATKVIPHPMGTILSDMLRSQEVVLHPEGAPGGAVLCALVGKQRMVPNPGMEIWNHYWTQVVEDFGQCVGDNLSCRGSLPARKWCPKKSLKIERKMVTNGVAVRAVNIPMVRIDTEFRDESNGDIPGVPWGQKFGKK